MSRFSLPLAADLGEVPDARRFVAEALRGFAIAESVLADVVLAASELVTNAVEHGRGIVEVEVAEERGVIRVSVSNDGSADLGPVSTWSPPAAGEVRGRGLAIVRALSDDVTVVNERQRLTVSLYRRSREQRTTR